MDQPPQMTPLSEEAISAYEDTVIPWADAQLALAGGRTFWLSTLGPEATAHVRPHFAVWVDGTLYFTANLDSRKARNLARDPRCTIATQSNDLDMVVEGSAAQVADEVMLQRVADAYIAKYGWPDEVHDGAFTATFGAPTAGPPPYHVFAVSPTTIYAFGNGPVTRWRFAERTD